MRLPTAADIVNAYRFITPQLPCTPLRPCLSSLSLETPGDHWFKLENLQPTGSFKVRGALEALRHSHRPLITASSGNHGAAVAWAAAQAKVPVQVVVPVNAPQAKQRKIEMYGAEIVRHGSLYDEAEEWAKQEAEERSLHYLSSFSDPAVIAGQGTVAVEILQQLPQTGTVLVPVGGGGLLAGMGCWIKEQAPSIQVVGVQPTHSCPMARSFQERRVTDVTHRPTWSDATAGGISPITLQAALQWADAILTVPEVAIEAAMEHYLNEEHLVVEGAGALSLAASLSGQTDAWPTPIVHVVSGGNLDLLSFLQHHTPGDTHQ